MIQPLSIRPVATARWACRASRCAALGTLTLLAASAVSAAPLSYSQAVVNTDAAARAVLARAGRETCLRGKLTRALLGLSSSCEVSGTRNALCSLADKAVVVTPMSLTFMDDTSHQLLELIHPERSTAQASARRAAPDSEQPAEP